MCKRRCARQFCSEPCRNLRGPLKAALDVTQVSGGDIVCWFSLGQPIAYTRINAARVQNIGHRGMFFCALRRRPFGHHGFLIPAKAASHLTQRFCVALECHQIIVSSHLSTPNRLCARILRQKAPAQDQRP